MRCWCLRPGESVATLGTEAVRLVLNRSTTRELSSQAVSPLRQRMIEDMRMRKLCDRTQVAYIRAVRKLAAYVRHLCSNLRAVIE